MGWREGRERCSGEGRGIVCSVCVWGGGGGRGVRSVVVSGGGVRGVRGVVVRSEV